MACNISDEGLYEFAERVKGQTVIITGAARGIGKEAALEFAKRGANLVIGDIDVKGSEQTVEEIKRIGGDAVSRSCNVLIYEDLVSLFQLALTRFGQVDVVIANAGVTEVGQLLDVKLDEHGLPMKPNMTTMEVNIVSIMYTTQLASHYLAKNQKTGSLKTLILIGSIASIMGLHGAYAYSSSKHAVLALLSSLMHDFKQKGLRVTGVFPWFADTPILPVAFKLFMTGIPMVPVPRAAGAIFLAATDGAPDTNGAAYTLPDEREVFRISHPEINENIHALIASRVKRHWGMKHSIKTLLAFASILAQTTAAKVLMVIVIICISIWLR
ncbi:hypothetical protein M0805_009427 [Coniferiporia weirii]|nr:hypothetical protein M0805_009427 [Coniferiporia weirii]